MLSWSTTNPTLTYLMNAYFTYICISKVPCYWYSNHKFSVVPYSLFITQKCALWVQFIENHGPEVSLSKKELSKFLYISLPEMVIHGLDSPWKNDWKLSYFKTVDIIHLCKLHFGFAWQLMFCQENEYIVKLIEVKLKMSEACV